MIILKIANRGPKNYSMEWNGMWNEKKQVEWIGNGIKINKISWNGMEMESTQILRDSTKIYAIKI
jgi:hypothetical protein